MGIKTIMEAKKIIVLANGRKGFSRKQAIEGPITNAIPASILQKHNDVTWVLDQDHQVSKS